MKNHQSKGRRPVKIIDREKSIRYLKNVFMQATEDFGRDNTRGTLLHNLQVEFAYHVNNIGRDPEYLVSKHIADCNEFLDDLISRHDEILALITKKKQ